jgi:hypothetical protein
MFVKFSSVRNIHIFTLAAVVLSALTVSAYARPVKVPTDRDHRTEGTKQLPPPKGTYDQATAKVREHRKPAPKPGDTLFTHGTITIRQGLTE